MVGLMARMNPRDALMYWLSAKIPNDQFLVYAFAGVTDGVEAMRAHVARRAPRIADLSVALRDARWDYPHWVPKSFDAADVVVHEGTGLDDIVGTAVDPLGSPWRLHVLPGEPLLVVLQLSHALADGRRGAAVARKLFGPAEPDDPPPPDSSSPLAPLGLPRQFAGFVAAGRRAHRAYRETVRLTAAGDLPPQLDGRPLSQLNVAGAGHVTRVLPVDLKNPATTVTVAALTVVSEALRRHLDEVPPRLGAEVTVANAGTPSARNHFRNVGVDLFPDEPDLRRRAELIAAALRERVRRSGHPAVTGQGAALYAMPAPMLRAGVARHDLTVTPATVSGHTVLTSVDRGPADLRFGGGTVVYTAGFPALSPAMGLTHGLYGIGGALTLCVHARPAALPDPDAYLTTVQAAAADVGSALRH